MHWGVDAHRLAGQRLGVGRYIEYLVKHWRSMMQNGDRCTLFTREPYDGVGWEPSPAIDVRAVASPLPPSVWQHGALPHYARGIDVLFCPSYSVPVTYAGRCVVAIHSMNEVESGTHPWWYKLTYSKLYRFSADRADRIIVPSESTRQDIERYYGITSDKVDIVVQGADESFHPITDEAVKRATRLRFLGADRPYIVFVGKLSTRRNIPVLMEAFALVKRRTRLPHALLLVGPNQAGVPLDELSARHGLQGDVVQTDGRFSSHLELPPIYASADLYVNASSYEGFSMTLVEALSCGTPVVTVNRSALAEIAAGAAEFVEEPTPEGLADAIERVLTDRALSRSLSERGVRRADAFRWDVTARQTLDVLRRVAS
ncbi:MAG: glycosyltransferase family 4 protein [Chloroflexi bacterium]|nr:glycosyltransferase family 4 protein [Chloroflexota bacterium]